MELKQRVIITIRHFKKTKAAEIRSKLGLCFGNNAYTFASVHHWVHEFEMGLAAIGDDSQRGRRLDDFDAAILKRLLEAPFSPPRTLSEDLHILRVTVWEHLTKFHDLQCHHFKWPDPCSRRSSGAKGSMAQKRFSRSCRHRRTLICATLSLDMKIGSS
jgi:hypothetical protein